METWDTIRARRNVRQYTDQPIARDNLERILEAGRRGGGQQRAPESPKDAGDTGVTWRNSVTLVPASHLRRSNRRSSSTSPPHTP
jgi:hypothetical protein